MNLLLGIGNIIRGDDGVGPHVARVFAADGWETLDCGTMPENFTGKVRATRPDLLVLVDAAELGLRPGSFRIIGKDEVRDVSIGTHMLPLSLLMEFLSDLAGEILFIGIQPGMIGDYEKLSPEVREGAQVMMKLIREGRMHEIQKFER